MLIMELETCHRLRGHLAIPAGSDLVNEAQTETQSQNRVITYPCETQQPPDIKHISKRMKSVTVC